ncbi:serine hydrolase domain-containing protein [Sphingomonas cavernae]|uniref:Class A beta-lactamase-related serine hydrolase n=1 Tax=Sphingomonas cavernae TaxID=2320861 RepID=A0A418WKG8_9SPHN|nr:serine hydrolase domain-containing protein [Sphingomonas cavernae]RJF90510.1 class A beta-lactamase-related serine hydrolase [Sphingomonas cavernae]
MADLMLERRDFIRALTAIGFAAALPAPLLARTRDWAEVSTLFDGLVPDKLPALAAVIGRGTDKGDFLARGRLARDSMVAVNRDTLWRVYSMTKPITGMAAMMLIEDGKLGLDQNIADFIPGFANPRVLTEPDTSLASRAATAPITVRHLLTHTAGLGYSIITRGPLLKEYLRLGITPAALSRTKQLDDTSAPPAPSLKEFADRLATLPLITDPGSRWSYSVSLDLLGRVIEVASGKSFDGFLQERMFDPLGMTSSYWRVPKSEVGRFVTNYWATPQGLTPVDPAASSIYLDQPAFPFGGAGLVMSARDYDRFLLMLMGWGAIKSVRVMKPETARLGMSNLLPQGVTLGAGFPPGTGFGAGGRVATRSIAGGKGEGAYGWEGAAGTVAWVDPARGIRACGFAQFLPFGAFSFQTDFPKAVYAGVA